jgi:hypothetical protein
MSNQSSHCPKCGSRDWRPTLVLKRQFSIWWFLLGGWLIAFLYGMSRKEQVRCVGCETIYERRSVFSKVALAILIFMMVLIVIGILTSLLGQ